MIENKNIVWIPSYPKSGNTWMRTILTGLIYSDSGKFNFDLLSNIDQFDNPINYQFVKDINITDYENLHKMQIVSKYWQQAQEKIGSKNVIFYKTHSANYSYENLNYTNLKKTRGCIYMLRDPRDVAISYAKFIDSSLDETIAHMINSNRQIYNQTKTIGVVLSRWDYHVASWMSLDAPTLIIRYEDLLNSSQKVMEELLKFMKDSLKINFKYNDEKINNILESTSFSRLKENEEKKGFNEASKNSKFFRSGKSNQWKSILSEKQLHIIETNLREYMLKFNYL